MFKIAGYNDEQLAALCEMWHLGRPVDVNAFFGRADIPDDVKVRVREAGKVPKSASVAELADAHRMMQGRIVIEVAGLDKERWNPFEAKAKLEPKGKE